MNILLLSDTHGYLSQYLHILKLYSPQIDLIIHLGGDDGDIMELKHWLPTHDIIGLSGVDINGYHDSYKYDKQKILTIENKKILCTYGHSYQVLHDLTHLQIEAEKQNVDIVLYGQTHKNKHELINNIHYICPGSLFHSKSEGAVPSIAFVKIAASQTDIECKFIDCSDITYKNMNDKQIIERVALALHTVPHEYRDVITFLYYWGLSKTDIALLFGRSIKTIYLQQAIGFKILFSCLRQEIPIHDEKFVELLRQACIQESAMDLSEMEVEINSIADMQIPPDIQIPPFKKIIEYKRPIYLKIYQALKYNYYRIYEMFQKM